jgi:NAD(P)-dependent dehydrogenase (short-subunit alcohol dehydrogenase family)
MTVVRACRAALPHLQRRGGGRIVTVAAYSIRAQKPFLTHYAAMKSAVASVTKNIAKSYGQDRIGANCIAPGAIDTEALDAAADEAMSRYGVDREAALARFMAEKWGMNVALGRPGRVQEVAALIAFLLSPRAEYLTGALINIDGGTDF